jgi:hypothetical protein
MKTEEYVDHLMHPRDASSEGGVPARRQPGYYPGFSTLSQKPFWDAATRKLIVDRVEKRHEIKFFSRQEFEFWTAVFSHLIPQSDRTPDGQIDVIGPLDHRLYVNQTVGYRYENMPQDRVAYKLGLEAINKEAQHSFGEDFLSIPWPQQELVLKAIHDGKPQAAPEIWKSMSVHRFWQLIMGDAIDAYYAHPWAWDEIGFGGPAYPRAYTRLERGEPEPWEVEEQRYQWAAPRDAVSDEVESVAHHNTEAHQHGGEP